MSEVSKPYLSNLRNLTLAEWLALTRIITFPPMMVLIFILERRVFGWVYIALFFTDVLDGLAANLMKNDSDRREVLDSWGDILYLLIGIVAFFYFEPRFFISRWPFILIIAGLYLLQLVISLIKFGKPTHFHNYLTKVAVFFMVLFLLYLFLFSLRPVLFYIAIAFCSLDVIDQFIILLRIRKWETHISGFWKVI